MTRRRRACIAGLYVHKIETEPRTFHLKEIEVDEYVVVRGVKTTILWVKHNCLLFMTDEQGVDAVVSWATYASGSDIQQKIARRRVLEAFYKHYFPNPPYEECHLAVDKELLS